MGAKGPRLNVVGPQNGGHEIVEHRIMALSDTAIRNAKPKEKPYKIGDSLGLFLLVRPSGGKLWRLKYRIDGREKI